MSTKTSIKRVALVAVAALTLGGISAASSFAATYPGLQVTTANGANSVSAWATNPADTTTVGATVGTYVLETLTANAADSVYNITSTGVGSISIAPSVAPYAAESRNDSLTAAYSVGTNAVQYYYGSAPGLGTFPASTGHTLTFAVYSATAGTQTITVAGNSSTAVVQTITWGAAPAISIANSKSVLINMTPVAASDIATVTTYIGASTADSTTALPVSAGAGNGAAVIGVRLLNDQATTGPIAGDSLTALVSGNALVVGTNTTGGSYVGSYAIAASSTTDTNGYAVFGVSTNGASGTATITISYTNSSGVSTVVATKTVSFYSSTIAKLTPTVNYKYIPLAAVTGYTYAGGPDVTTATKNSGAFSGGLDAPAISVVASDANGNAISQASTGSASSITVTSSNTLVATVATNPTYDTTLKAYYPVITPVSEGTTTLTFADAATGLITGTAVVNVSKAVISSVTTATDANSYDPATQVKYTITALDAAGNPVADGYYTGFYVSGDEPVTNVALQGGTSITTDTLTTVSGVEKATFYAPVTPGTTVTIAGGTLPGTAGSATAGASFIVAALNGSTQGGASFTVNGGSDASGAVDAANAATDAANAAADAADNATQAASEALAAVNSLATTVASLIAGIKAQITSLTNLITKIKNKVGA